MSLLNRIALWKLFYKKWLQGKFIKMVVLIISQLQAIY